MTQLFYNSHVNIIMSFNYATFNHEVLNISLYINIYIYDIFSFLAINALYNCSSDMN